MAVCQPIRHDKVLILTSEGDKGCLSFFSSSNSDQIVCALQAHLTQSLWSWSRAEQIKGSGSRHFRVMTFRDQWSIHSWRSLILFLNNKETKGDRRGEWMDYTLRRGLFDVRLHCFLLRLGQCEQMPFWHWSILNQLNHAVGLLVRQQEEHLRLVQPVRKVVVPPGNPGITFRDRTLHIGNSAWQGDTSGLTWCWWRTKFLHGPVHVRVMELESQVSQNYPVSQCRERSRQVGSRLHGRQAENVG